MMLPSWVGQGGLDRVETIKPDLVAPGTSRTGGWLRTGLGYGLEGCRPPLKTRRSLAGSLGEARRNLALGRSVASRLAGLPLASSPLAKRSLARPFAEGWPVFARTAFVPSTPFTAPKRGLAAAEGRPAGRLAVSGFTGDTRFGAALAIGWLVGEGAGG